MRRARRGMRKFVVRVINNQEIRGWQGTKRGSNGYATRTENSTINIFRGVAAHLSLSLSPSLSLDFYPTRIVSKCGPHILSLSLSLDMPLLWGDRGERRAVKSFMNFKQGPRIEEPRDHFSFFRCHVGERGMEREMDRDGSRVNRAEIRRGEKGRGGDDKLQ